MAEIERYIARMLIPKFIDLGYAGSAIIRELRNLGYSYRYQNMLSDIREQVQIAEFGAAVRNWDVNTIPTSSIMTDTELNIPRRYRILGMAKLVNNETGRATYKNISFYTDTLGTKSDWEQEYIGAKGVSESIVGVTITSLDIFVIEHNTGFSY